MHSKKQVYRSTPKAQGEGEKLIYIASPYLGEAREIRVLVPFISNLLTELVDIRLPPVTSNTRSQVDVSWRLLVGSFQPDPHTLVTKTYTLAVATSQSERHLS